MGNKIVLKTESDVALSNYRPKTDLYSNEAFKFSGKQVGDGYVGDITVEKNMRTNERKIAVGVVAQYKNKNIETPFITITQQAHPKYYVEGETKVSKDYFDEFGGVFTVSTVVANNIFSALLTEDISKDDKSNSKLGFEYPQ